MTSVAANRERIFICDPAKDKAKAPDACAKEVFAALAGYFTHRALQPPPPGLPTLRAFQAAQGEVARQWLAHRTGLG